MSTPIKILCLYVTLALAACSPPPEPAPTALPDPGIPVPSQKEAPSPEQPAATPGTLAESIPVAVWKEGPESHHLVPFDPASGQALAVYEVIDLGQAIFHAFSPDQRTLAVVGFESGHNPRNGRLHLIDLRTWEDQVYELQIDGYVNAMAFSPDGKQLAISHGSGESRILVIHMENPFKATESTMRQTELDFLVYKMRFSVDGSGLTVYGSKIENRYTVNEMSPNPPVVNLFDSADLSLRWEASLEGVRHGIVPKAGKEDAAKDLHQPGQAIYLFPGLVFAPDRDLLYVVHPDADKLTTVDFSAQKTSTVEIRPRLSFIERLLALTAGVAHAKIAEGTSKQAAISPDGQFLYIVGQRTDIIQDKNGNWQVLENPLGLQVVHAENGSRLASYDSEASELAMSPDGQLLYLRSWGDTETGAWTEIFDTSTRQTVTRMDGLWLVPTRKVNGSPVLASSVMMNNKGEHHNAVVDSQEVLTQWNTPAYLAWLTTQ